MFDFGSSLEYYLEKYLVRKGLVVKQIYRHRDTELGSLLGKSKALMERILAREMSKIQPMATVQGGILHAMYDGRDYSIEELMKITLKERTTVSRLASRLRDKGLITKEAVPGNKKIKLRITEKGRQSFNPSLIETTFTSILAGLSVGEKETLHSLLTKLISHELALLESHRENSSVT